MVSSRSSCSFSKAYITIFCNVKLADIVLEYCNKNGRCSFMVPLVGNLLNALKKDRNVIKSFYISVWIKAFKTDESYLAVAQFVLDNFNVCS